MSSLTPRWRWPWWDCVSRRIRPRTRRRRRAMRSTRRCARTIWPLCGPSSPRLRTRTARDEQGDAPLLYAAAVGSLETMKLLLDKGADVNAQNGFGTTALMISAIGSSPRSDCSLNAARTSTSPASRDGRRLFIAAMSDESAAIVTHLVGEGRQPEGTRCVRQHGPDCGGDRQRSEHRSASPSTRAWTSTRSGSTGVSPLMLSAGYHANLAATKLLLAKGAKVNAVAESPALFPIDDPKSGPLALHTFTPLLHGDAARAARRRQNLARRRRRHQCQGLAQHDAVDVCRGNRTTRIRRSSGC